MSRAKYVVVFPFFCKHCEAPGAAGKLCTEEEYMLALEAQADELATLDLIGSWGREIGRGFDEGVEIGPCMVMELPVELDAQACSSLRLRQADDDTEGSSDDANAPTLE